MPVARGRDGASHHEFAITISEKDGKLRLWLPREYSGRRQWNDGPRGRIETKLADVLAELEARARALEEHRRAMEEERRRREEAWERALEVARGRYEEALRANVLQKQLANRRLAQEIRFYCRELRARWGEGRGAPASEEWIRWAEAYAEAIDPITEPPSMPEVPEPEFEDLRPFLQEMRVGRPSWL